VQTIERDRIHPGTGTTSQQRRDLPSTGMTSTGRPQPDDPDTMSTERFSSTSESRSTTADAEHLPRMEPLPYEVAEGACKGCGRRTESWNDTSFCNTCRRQGGGRVLQSPYMR